MAKKTTERKLTLGDAIEEAYGDFQALGEEMREAFDNTPENLQQSSVGQAREEAADNLEQLSEPTVPDWAKEEAHIITHTQFQRTPRQMSKLSRAARRDEAVELLRTASQYLDELFDKLEEDTDMKGEVDALRDEIETLVGDVENVEFPGMRG